MSAVPSHEQPSMAPVCCTGHIQAGCVAGSGQNHSSRLSASTQLPLVSCRSHLNPLSINIAIQHNPLVLVGAVIGHITVCHAHQPLLPLSCGWVQIAIQLIARDSLCASNTRFRSCSQVCTFHFACSSSMIHWTDVLLLDQDTYQVPKPCTIFLNDCILLIVQWSQFV